MLNDPAVHAMLDQLATIAGFAALHTAFPGSNFANEVTGGSPAYARKAITWSAAASRNLDSSNQPLFDVPGSTEIRFATLASASTAGTQYGISAIGSGGIVRRFVPDIALNTITCIAHGLVNDERVTFIGGTPPTGLTEGNVYWVVSASTDAFQVSLTQGGAAIDLTGAGQSRVAFSRIVPETFGSQGTLRLDDFDIAFTV